MQAHLSRYDIQLLCSSIINLNNMAERHLRADNASPGSVIHMKWNRLVEYIDAACDELHINKQITLDKIGLYNASSLHALLRMMDVRLCVGQTLFGDSNLMKLLISICWRLTDICVDISALNTGPRTTAGL